MEAKQTLIPVKNYTTTSGNLDTSLETVRPLFFSKCDDKLSATLYDMYGTSTIRPIETYNLHVDNRNISDNLSDLEDKLDLLSSDEIFLVNVMLESREVYEKQTAEPEAKADAELSVKG